MKDPVLLFGGGLESTWLFFKLIESKKKFKVLFVDYGQSAVKEELSAVRSLCRKFNIESRVIKTEILKTINEENTNLLLDGEGESFVWARNLVLCTIAASYSNMIVTGSHSKDPVSDASDWFYRHLLKTLEASFNRKITIVRPGGTVSKKSMALFCLKFDKNILSTLFSCWLPKRGKPCGTCAHCEKINSLKALTS